MSKIAITTENAPRALGPYSQAVIQNSLVFISGQIPLDPKNNAIISENKESQVRQTFQNLSNIAHAAGCALNDCLKLTVFVTDLSDFDLINTTMKEFFCEPYPARSVVEVRSLPKGGILEIDAILALSHD